MHTIEENKGERGRRGGLSGTKPPCTQDRAPSQGMTQVQPHLCLEKTTKQRCGEAFPRNEEWRLSTHHKHTNHSKQDTFPAKGSFQWKSPTQWPIPHSSRRPAGGPFWVCSVLLGTTAACSLEAPPPPITTGSWLPWFSSCHRPGLWRQTLTDSDKTNTWKGGGVIGPRERQL